MFLKFLLIALLDFLTFTLLSMDLRFTILVYGLILSISKIAVSLYLDADLLKALFCMQVAGLSIYRVAKSYLAAFILSFLEAFLLALL